MQNESNDSIKACKDLFHIFSDMTRLRIIDLLIERPHNVQSICAALDLKQSTVSHQLRLLRERNIVKYERDGKHIIYSLKDAHVKTIYLMAKDHVNEC
ncbi:MAG: ArsR/SmtB family transcription factor [Bacillota bacterium]